MPRSTKAKKVQQQSSSSVRENDDVTYDSLVTEGRSQTSGRGGSRGSGTPFRLQKMQQMHFMQQSQMRNHHLHPANSVEVVVEQEMEDMKDCDDPKIVAEAKDVWDRLCDETVSKIKENECIVMNCDAFGTKDMDWGRSMGKILPKLMCFLRNEFATVQRCSDELRCVTEEYRCLSKERADCDKRKQDEMAKSNKDRNVCLLQDIRLNSNRISCALSSLEQKARECRRKIKDSRKNIDILAGQHQADPKTNKYTLHLDGHFVPEATGALANLLSSDLPAGTAGIKKGDRHLSFADAQKDAEAKSLLEAIRGGYLFDVFQVLLRAKLVKNERTFFTEIRKMRLQELIEEAERCQIEEGGPDGDRVHCPYQCSCATPAMIQQLVNSQQLSTTSKSKKLPSTIPASMIRMLPTLRCRCNAWSMYEKLCKERQDLRRKLRADPAEAFSLDDEKLLKYIRTEIFGEPEANYEANKDFIPQPQGGAAMGGFFRWFMTYVLEWEGTIENPTAKAAHVFSKDQYSKDLATASGTALSTEYKKDWSGMSFFKNLVEVAQNLRSRTDCCRVLQPGKLVAECLLYARQRGCFVQCCTKGREIFERVYCDKDTGSLAFICQFVTDFLLASRNVPLSGSVSGKALYNDGGDIKTVEYKDDTNTDEDRKHGMKVSPNDSFSESLEIKDYWKKLSSALITVMGESIFKKNALVRTHSEELARNYRARVAGTARRLHEANEKTPNNADPYLYLHEGDLRAIRLLKEHRMIGGNPSTSDPKDANYGNCDPFRTPQDAALAHVSHFDSLPKDQTFWQTYLELSKKTTNVKTFYENDVTEGNMPKKESQVVIEKSLLLIALESGNFKDKFNLEKVKTKEGIAFVHKALIEQTKTPEVFEEIKGFFFKTKTSADEKEVNQFLLSNENAKVSNEKTAQGEGRIYLNETFDRTLTVEDWKNPTDSKDVTQWETASMAKIQQVVIDLCKKIAQLYKQFKLVPMISIAVSGEAKENLVGFSAQASSEAGEVQDEMGGASYQTAAAAKFNDTTGGNETKFTDTGSGDRYDYLSTVVLCNREMDCSSGLLLSPGMSLLSPHADLLLLSEGERARREDSFKLLKSLLDVLFRWHGSNQHWGTMAKAILKSVESVEC